MKPRLLDLFCGAGGAGVGYARAGFEVVGVDNRPQPRYPFEFHEADALEYPLEGFDAIHASPPCQAYSALRCLPWLRDRPYWDSIPPTLERLEGSGLPWVLENVERAPLDGITLCGQQFGLAWPDGSPIYRHRRFASNLFMLAPGHGTHRAVIVPGRMVGDRISRGFGLNNGRVIGGHQSGMRTAGAAMGIDWMTGSEVTQAIPPAYTEYIGARLLEAIRPGVGSGREPRAPDNRPGHRGGSRVRPGAVLGPPRLPRGPGGGGPYGR